MLQNFSFTFEIRLNQEVRKMDCDVETIFEKNKVIEKMIDEVMISHQGIENKLQQDLQGNSLNFL